MSNDKIELKDVRKTLLWSDPSEYKHRVAWYKRDKLREIRDLDPDIAEKFGFQEPEKVDEEMLDEDYWRSKTRDLWLSVEPETPDEIFDWYGSYDAYIVENMIRQAEVVDDIRQCHRWFRQYDVNSVLDYGGGVGDFALYHALNGYNVAYADVKGSFPDFVKKRVRERSDVGNVLIRELHGPKETPSDAISTTEAAICLEVIEHLPHVEEVIDGFADVIVPGGFLVSSWTFSDWSDDPDDVYTPCHINTGRSESRQVSEYMELYFEEIDYTWNKQMRLWQRRHDG